MVMKKKPTKKMMAGGRTKGTKYKAAGGGKMPMVKKNGKMIPAFAADGKGKMKKGGKAKKKSGGSKPKNPALYARVKAEAKRKFKVYPSAYANAWLVRTYKKRGGKYRSG